MRGRELFAWVAVVLSIVLPAMAGESDGVADAAAVAFERLKGLEGEWSAVTPDGDATIVYRVAAAGSIVVEHLFPGTDHEMLTVYHRDGADLVATHYCSAGNQPRFKLEQPGGSPDRLHFAFNGGSNMAPGDGHIHEGWLRFVDAEHVEAEWAFWKDGEPDHSASFAMTRRHAE
jgi:hypothetical protein